MKLILLLGIVILCEEAEKNNLVIPSTNFKSKCWKILQSEENIGTKWFNEIAKTLQSSKKTD